MAPYLPYFYEHTEDPLIPEGYGIDCSGDLGFYPYRLMEDGLPHYLKDAQALDIRCATRAVALAMLQVHTLDMTNIEDPAVQVRLLAVHERQIQEEQQVAAFYDLMAESQ